MKIEPTGRPDVDAFLAETVHGVERVLGARFRSLALHGSLATGDFEPATSDVDLVVVTDVLLEDALLPALAAMHRDVARVHAHWGTKAEVSYLPAADLRRFDPARTRHPALAVGAELAVREHGPDWVIQRHVLREHGIVVAGAPVRPLIDPVGPDDLRFAVRGILSTFWSKATHDTSWLSPPEYQAFAVLTMCRAAHTLATGSIVSKPVAASFALEVLDLEWRDLIRHARDWRPGAPFGRLAETVAFVRDTIERAGAPRR